MGLQDGQVAAASELLPPLFHPYRNNAAVLFCCTFLESPPLGVTQHPALWSSDFPHVFLHAVPCLTRIQLQYSILPQFRRQLNCPSIICTVEVGNDILQPLHLFSLSAANGSACIPRTLSYFLTSSGGTFAAHCAFISCNFLISGALASASSLQILLILLYARNTSTARQRF